MDIDEDVLLAVKQIAQREGRTQGQTVSDLLRSVIANRNAVSPVRNGIWIFQREGGKPADLELVNRLRDE